MNKTRDVQIKEVQELLDREIPISQALGAKVVGLSAELVSVSAPLQVNRNHMGTAFGGSIYNLLILAGYTWLYSAVLERKINCHVILQKSEIEYLKPISSDLLASCKSPESDVIERFFTGLEKKSRARIQLTMLMESSGQAAARCTSAFIAEVSR